MLLSLSSSLTSTMSITSFPPFSSSIPNKLHQSHTATPLHLYKIQHSQQYPPPKNHRFTTLHLQHHPHLPRCTGPNSTPVDEDESELHEGIIEILLEAGVSVEEARGIAVTAKKYGKMLSDGVKELDELSLWGSYMNGKMEGVDETTLSPPFSFKKKVKIIAKEKGDYGKIAYLESVGLSLSSAVHLARIVSSQSIISLISKVNYVKEIFFSGSDERQAGKNARRMMLHLSLSVDEDVQLSLSFYEKIEARRGGLDMLGCCDTSFRYLIESFPRILLLSESRMIAAVTFLENIGVPKERIGYVLLLHPPLLFLDTKEASKDRLWAYEKISSLDGEIGKMLVKYPWLLSPSIRKNYDKILAFFETSKVPKNSIDRAVQDWPLLLGCSPDKLKPMVVLFDDLGVKTVKLGKVIATSPQLLLRRPEEFLKVVSFLADMGLDTDSIRKILTRCPEIFAVRTVETLLQKLEFLTSFGILKQQQCRVIKKYPEFFVSDVNCTVMPRLWYLTKWGLSKRDVASMVVRFSPLLGYSIDEVLKPKLEFLVTMGKSVMDVVKYPRYFSYSLEKKIRPRFLALSSRNIDFSLEEMLSKNDDEFTSDYLGGIEEMFVPSNR